MVKKYLLLWFLICLSPIKAFALTELTTEVNLNPVIEGEYVTLSITADDDIDSNKIDLTPLNQDFNIVRKNINKSSNYINGVFSKTTTWKVVLLPKQVGSFEIPSFSIENVKSNPIELKVIEASDQPADRAQKDLFLKTTLSTKEAYLGQIINYQVKLYFTSKLQSGIISAPSSEGAQIKQLGEDKSDYEIVNGTRYRVIERNYSIIADKVGEISLQGANFNGDVISSKQQPRGMFSFQSTEPRYAKSESNLITVKPIPDNYQGEWFIADHVNLNEDWDEKQKFQVGQPITRNIRLIAVNADEGSLPELPLAFPSEFKSYPEKSVRKMAIRNNQILAQLTQSIAIVPSKAGTYTLPEIRVPWWNPQRNKQEFAVLPARTIKVNAATNTPTPNVVTNTAIDDQTTTAGFWPWLTALFAILWLISTFLWLNAKRATPTKTINLKPVIPTSHSFAAACKSQQPNEVLAALLVEIKQITGKTVTLNELASFDKTIAQLANEIQAACYSQQDDDASRFYPQLIQAVTSFKQAYKAQKHQHSPLSQLNS